MLTLRVEDLGDRVGYVVQDGQEELETFETRADAELYIFGMGLGREEVVKLGIQMTKDYAKEHHGDQPHGCLKMTDHLNIVSALVDFNCKYSEDSAERLQVVAAAVLHDIIEDTSVTVADLRRDFSDEIAELVDVLTDKPGKNRYERHLNTYWRIREKGSDAVLIKLCDRLANHARSLTHKERYLEMYVNEYDYFKMALWRPNEHVKLWEMLDTQFKLMKEECDGKGLQKGS